MEWNTKLEKSQRLNVAEMCMKIKENKTSNTLNRVLESGYVIAVITKRELIRVIQLAHFKLLALT